MTDSLHTTEVRSAPRQEVEAGEYPVTPIIVVGMNRSGTKWLSNILCNHSQIAGVQSERHGGIHETNFFGAIQRFVGDISQVQNYIALVELWSQTDFCKAAKLEKECLYQLSPRPTSCLEMFERIMSLVASREGKRFWLQKTSPIHSGVLRQLKAYHTIVVRRKMVPTLESTVKLYQRRRVRLATVRAMFLYVLQDKLLSRLCRDHQTIYVKYERLKNNTLEEIERVCRKLGLPFEPDMIRLRFQPNTSFPSANESRHIFSSSDLFRIRLLYVFLSLIPLPILKAVRSALGSRRPYLVVRTYSEIIEKYGLE